MNDILGRVSEDPIFSFSAGEGNGGLKFTSPSNTGVADAVEDTRNGASSVEIFAPVSISVGGERGIARAKGKEDAIVKGATKISEDLFGCMEVCGFGILHVANDLANSIADVGAGVQ